MKKGISIVVGLFHVVVGYQAIGQNVGVGTTNPSAYLHVLAPNSINAPMLRVERAGGPHPFLYISSTGLVGIGTANPSEALEVSGNVKFSGSLMPGGSAGTAGQILMSQGPGNPPVWIDSSVLGGSGGDNWGSQVAITSSPIIGNGTTANPITFQSGTTPGEIWKWDGSQWILAQDSIGQSGDTVCFSAINNILQKWTGTQLCNSSIYDSASRVGIATTSPLYTLHIGGNGSFLAGGTFGTGDTIHSGPKTSLVWLPRRAAIRAGQVTGGQWDWNNIGEHSVAFGLDNRAVSNSSAVLAGSRNTAINLGAIVVGGNNNTAKGINSVIVAGNISNIDSTGQNAFIGGGGLHNVSGQNSFIGAGGVNTINASEAGIVAGRHHVISGDYSFIGGGVFNDITGWYSHIISGWDNAVNNWFSGIGSGRFNTVSGRSSFIAAGDSNIVSGDSSFLGAGQFNVVSGDLAFVGAGFSDTASGLYSVVCGGYGNLASGVSAFVGAGGGTNSWGTSRNIASGNFSAVVSGWYNTASGESSFIGSGNTNSASGFQAIVVGGNVNKSTGIRSIVVGGIENTSSGGNSFIGGGGQNQVSGDNASIVGGTNNNVTGMLSVIVGGSNNSASGAYNLVFGNGVTPPLVDNRVFFFDGTVSGALVINNDTYSGNNPIHVGTTTTNGNGAFLSPGGVWTNASSRSFKNRFETISDQEILIKINNLTIPAWYYVGTQERHIGPIAEEFTQTFNVGVLDDTLHYRYISALDVAGVSLRGVQALIRENQKLKQQISDLQEALNQAQQEREDIMKQLKQLQQAINQ